MQAPVIGLLIAVVFHSGALTVGASPIGAVELVFLLMTGAIWLGVASAAREVVKELPKNFLGKVLRRKLRESPPEPSVNGNGKAH